MVNFIIIVITTVLSVESRNILWHGISLVPRHVLRVGLGTIKASMASSLVPRPARRFRLHERPARCFRLHERTRKAGRGLGMRLHGIFIL